MSRLARSAVVAMAASVAVAAAADAAAAAPPVVGCRTASGADFPASVATPARSTTIGPLTLVGSVGYTELSLAEAQAVPWFKMPALLALGETVTLSVAPSHRDVARWRYGREHGRSALTLEACPPGKRGSTLGGRPVTFWSGGLEVSRLPVCLPLRFRVEGERRTRRWTLALGRECG